MYSLEKLTPETLLPHQHSVEQQSQYSWYVNKTKQKNGRKRQFTFLSGRISGYRSFSAILTNSGKNHIILFSIIYGVKCCSILLCYLLRYWPSHYCDLVQWGEWRSKHEFISYQPMQSLLLKLQWPNAKTRFTHYLSSSFNSQHPFAPGSKSN